MRMKTAAAFLLVCILAALTSCAPMPSPGGEPMVKSFFAMNTYNTITVYEDVSSDVLDKAEQLLKKLESLWSVTDEQSEIFKVNHAGGNPTEISRETAELLQYALDMCNQTNGALDISLYPVLTAWGFTTGEYHIPSEQELAEKMQRVGYEKITLSDSMITLPSGSEIDLGAVAKGYACDLLTDMLIENDVSSAIISLGGNIQAIGSKPDGSDWNISVQHPEAGDSLGILSLADASVVTSGAYERYFTGEDGQRYGHILDPATGKPAESGLASVTIIGESGRMCDALSTAIFVMGLDKATAYWQENGGFEMLIVTENGELYLTEGLEGSFSLAENHRDMSVQILHS